MPDREGHKWEADPAGIDVVGFGGGQTSDTDVVGQFADRIDAGRRLAECLLEYRGQAEVVVLALPRGGVPVGFQVAKAIGAPLDVLIVRKLGVPAQPELAFGAIGEGGVRLLNESVLGHVRVSDAEIATVEAGQWTELRRRAERYRGGRPLSPLAGKVALIVDDGFATGSTARAACLIARAQGAATVVLAAPIGSRDTVAELATLADEVVCPVMPVPFVAVGQGYVDFSQTSDDEVCDLLQRAGVRGPGGWARPTESSGQ